VLARESLDPAKIDKETAFIAAEVERLGVKDQFDLLCELSKAIQNAVPSCGYVHRDKQVFFALKVLFSDKRVRLLQLPPGSGKSWINILIAASLRT
jgi:hypothetical protein